MHLGPYNVRAPHSIADELLWHCNIKTTTSKTQGGCGILKRADPLLGEISLPAVDLEHEQLLWLTCSPSGATLEVLAQNVLCLQVKAVS